MNQEHAEQEVLRLADAWATAELRGDSAFLESTLADDFKGYQCAGYYCRITWMQDVEVLSTVEHNEYSDTYEKVSTSS